MTPMQVPLNPFKQFAVAAAGPLTSLAIGFGFAWALYHLTGRWHVTSHAFTGVPDTSVTSRLAGWATFILSFSAIQCSSLVIWNLFPSSIFDGGRLWRALLWPVIGLKRAVLLCIYASFALSGLAILAGFYFGAFMLVVFGVMICMTSIQESRAMSQSNYDLVLNVEPGLIGKNRGAGLLDRWRTIRLERLRAREEVEEQQEQEVLDRLLAKVSAQGLPALTTAERQSLARISRQQKARTAAHSSF